MDRKDLGISNDDIADIFGAGPAVPASIESAKVTTADIVTPPEKPAAAKSDPLYKLPEIEAKPQASAKTPAPEQPKSKLIMNRAEEAYRIQEELAAKAAEQKELAQAAAVAASAVAAAKDRDQDETKTAETKETGAAVSYGSLSDEKTVAEVIAAFNDFKQEFAKELAGKIDQKAIDNMMLRSLEKTALNFMLLRNTSWDSESDMKQDGSINCGKLVKNIAVYRDSIKEIDREVEESLKALMAMRLIAVKKGLGADKYAEIKNGLVRRAAVVEGGHKKQVAVFITKNVMETAMKKADEEK